MIVVGDIETAGRLLARVCALLGAKQIEVHVHGVSDDVLASMLVSGGNIHQVTDGLHVAELAMPGGVELNAYGRHREDRGQEKKPPSKPAHTPGCAINGGYSTGSVFVAMPNACDCGAEPKVQP